MKFVVKDVNISTGGILIAIINQKDAKLLDLHSGDRVIIKNNGDEVTCVLNISESNSAVPPGKIGLFEEVLDKLDIKNKQTIELSCTGKPESIIHIHDKLLGKKLSYKEILHIIRDITEDRLTVIEKTYFVSAGYVHGWSMGEIIDMTKAMVATGNRLKFSGVTLDKHCIGGVPGNRTTMVVIPIIAAAGFTIPKTSSRAITSPAGTADTMECLAKVELAEKRIKRIVKKTNACIVHGGSMNLAPADDKIIEVEHPLSIDAEGQLLASVMAKKYSVTANHVLIDIPMGPEVKTKNKREARHLKNSFETIGKKLSMKIKVIVTDGSQPIGNGIGPLLEAEDVMSVLRDDPLAPQDLKEKSLCIASHLLAMTKKYTQKSAEKKVKEILESGEALKKMNEIIKLQGKVKNPYLGKYRHLVKSRRAGRVHKINNHIIAKTARIAGAPDDKGAGIYLRKKKKHAVKKGDVLYEIYAYSKFKLDLAKDFIKKDKGYIIQ